MKWAPQHNIKKSLEFEHYDVLERSNLLLQVQIMLCNPKFYS